MPLVPTALGYDARVQLLHTEDALAVLDRAARVYNTAVPALPQLSPDHRRLPVDEFGFDPEPATGYCPLFG